VAILKKITTMTLLLSWIGKDSRKISSFYIASDSRISWPNSIKFDYSQKVFAFSKTPDILGYCGDVLYPTIIINQILSMGEEDILFKKDATRHERANIIFDELKRKFNEYPSETVKTDSIQIIHVSRDNEVDFICNIFSWSTKTGWTINEQKIPDSSDKVIVLGSGKDEFYARYLDYLRGSSGKTSRALFQCLSHSLFEIKDLKCGGSPQLVGLYNKFNGQKIGVIYQNRRFFLGKEMDKSEIINNIEWRNELFERCDGKSKKILDGAQKQPNELRP